MGGGEIKEITYGGDQENEDEGIGDLAPENLVPFDSTFALELVSTILLETGCSLGGGETLCDTGAVVLCGLLDREGVERSLRLDINDFFTHILMCVSKGKVVESEGVKEEDVICEKKKLEKKRVYMTTAFFLTLGGKKRGLLVVGQGNKKEREE